MGRKPLIILLLLIVMNFHQVENKTTFNIIRDVIRVSKDIYNSVKNTIDGVESIGEHDPIMKIYDQINTHSSSLYDVKTMMTEFSSQLDGMVMHMEAMHTAIIQLPSEIQLDTIKHRLAVSIRKINYSYNQTIRYSTNLSKFDNVTLKDLASTLTGRGFGNLQHNLLELKNEIAPTAGLNIHQGFLHLFTQHMEVTGVNSCGQESPIQFLYNLYETVIATEFMGQVAESFGYYLQNKLYNVDVNYALNISQKERQERLKDYFIQFNKYLGKASTSARSCDPTNLVRNVTFIEMEKLYRAVYIQDYNQIHSKSCKGTCSEIEQSQRWPYSRNYAFGDCRRLYQCRKLQISKICTMAPRHPRTYEWIEDHDGNIYGKKDGACRGRGWPVAADYVSKSHLCETCICTCEGDHKSSPEGVQAFSLLMTRSNTTDGMVVTGLRFSRRDAIVCIEIKQGKLLPDGGIEEGSEYWTDCNIDFPTSLRGIRPNTIDANRNLNDYVVISSDYNFVDLDDVITPQNHVVTGATFALSDSCEGHRHIQLKLEYMEFDFSSGQLNSSRKSISSSTCHTNKANIDGARNPLHEETPRAQTVPVTGSDSYIQFGMSDFKTDAGQTTLPFLEVTNVEIEPSAPLSGVGLFYKTSPGYGGFLAFRIHPINYNQYMEGLDMIDELLAENLDGSVVETATSLAGVTESSTSVSHPRWIACGDGCFFLIV